MRKLVKGTLVTAVSILLIGIAIYTVGLIGGGKEEVRAMEKNGELNFLTDRFNVWAAKSLGFSWGNDSSLSGWDNDIDIDLVDDESILSYHAHGSHHDSSEGILDYYQAGESLDASEITELDVELGGGYLCIMQDTTSDLQGNICITVDAPNDAEVSYYVKKGTLHIEGFKSKKWSMTPSIDVNIIYVTLPKDFAFQKSEIELGAGYIEISGGEYGKMDIEVGAGEVICDNIKTGKLEAEVGAGSMEVSDIEASEIDVSVAMGSVTIAEGAVSGNIELSCDMGSLYLEMQGAEEDFNYELECSMGNMTIGDSEYSGLGKEKYINNYAARELKAECSMGNIEVIFTD